MVDNNIFKRRRTLVISTVVILLAVAATMTALFYFLFRGNESYSSTGGSIDSSDVLSCYSSAPIDPFFSADSSTYTKHEIKIILKDGSADKIYYSFYGKYASGDDAANAEAALHAKYNLYFSETSVKPETLSPKFASVDTETRIHLYATAKEINSTTKKFFFIATDGSGDMTLSNLRKNYAEQGFVCSTNN